MSTKPSYKIKICGLTRREDLELVARMGADYGGLLIEVEQSHRSQSREQARRLRENAPLSLVMVTLNQSVEENIRLAEMLSPAALQLHGVETPENVAEIKQRVSCEIWKALHLPARESDETPDLQTLAATAKAYVDAGTDRFLVDASMTIKGQRQFGGTGKTVDWQTVRRLRERLDRPFFLAGGINPQNVVEALSVAHPFGVDLSSGVETVKGIKDPEKVLTLITRVREWEDREAGGLTSNRVC